MITILMAIIEKMTAVMTVTLMTIMIANNDDGDIEMMALDGSDGCEGLIGVTAPLPASLLTLTLVKILLMIVIII